MREKAIRHGHPSTIHLWWARRPLASSRAVLLALLLPDPCSPACPATFKKKARSLLSGVPGKVGTTDDELQRALLNFIANFASWDLAADRTYIDIARGLVRSAHGDEPPLVVDPFAGGGSIPLEALRLGCDTFASDLNPVASLILKVMLEDIPRSGPALADELRRVGAEIKRVAERELADLYPKDSDGANPIAYLWARTVRCESPKCGAEIPLLRSYWLSKKTSRRRALRTKVVRVGNALPQIEFEIFEPKSDIEVDPGTVSRAKATCLACGSVLPPDRVRTQLVAQRGGADTVFDATGRRIGGARLLVVVTLRAAEGGRHYRLPVPRDYAAVLKAQHRRQQLLDDWERNGKPGVCPIPDEPTPVGGGSGAGRAFSAQRYGMLLWRDLFSARQSVALSTIANATNKRGAEMSTVASLLALAIGKAADLGTAGTPWKPDAECPVHMLSGQKIPPFWDWAEAVLTQESSGSFDSAFGRTASAIEASLSHRYHSGTVVCADAANLGALPDDSSGVWFTDPPYYDAVPYAELSDFFFVWLKRVLPNHQLLRDPFDVTNPLTPKEREIVQDETKRYEGQVKDQGWFEGMMARAFAEGRRVLRDDGIGAVVFAHKTTEGWEALLSGMTRGGWTITGSWPIATEMGSRLRARDSAALATSVHLICRPRPEDAPVGDWATVLGELPPRVAAWMERLEGEGVRGADLVFACIGPALEIYSRYRKVETAAGEDVPLAAYLEKVWEVVGRTALENVLGSTEARAHNGVAGALEEDARLTALFLWTIETTDLGDDTVAEDDEESNADGDEDSGARSATGFSLVHDVVRRFAQPLGIELSHWEGRIIKTEKGVVRLLPVAERAKQLFGDAGADVMAGRIERDVAATGPNTLQGLLFPVEAARPAARVRNTRAQAQVPEEGLASSYQATTLDRVHVAMLLQAAGRANALRALLRAEQERGSDFLRLANALSALYPKKSEEKRLLDAMLLAMPK